MNKLLFGGAAALLIAATPVGAQPAPPTPPGVASGTAPMATPIPRAPQTRVFALSDHQMTRDEVSRHVGEMFAHLDTNRDGFITRNEVEAMHHGTRGKPEKGLAKRWMTMPTRAASFDRLDTNHDGSLSRQEYAAAKPQVREQRFIVMRDGNAAVAPGVHGADHMRMRIHAMRMGGMGRHLFDMADANHDGRVSLAEAQAAALAHFDKADANHDGRITPDEHRQVRKVWIERRTS